MLKELLEPSQEEQEEYALYQYVIHYCFMMLGWIRGKEGRQEESESYLQASKNLLKVGNKSSQFISASSVRTRSAE